MTDLVNKISAECLSKMIDKLPVRYGVFTSDGYVTVGPEDGMLYEAAKISYERNIKRMLGD